MTHTRPFHRLRQIIASSLIGETVRHHPLRTVLALIGIMLAGLLLNALYCLHADRLLERQVSEQIAALKSHGFKVRTAGIVRTGWPLRAAISVQHPIIEDEAGHGWGGQHLELSLSPFHPHRIALFFDGAQIVRFSDDLALSTQTIRAWLQPDKNDIRLFFRAPRLQASWPHGAHEAALTLLPVEGHILLRPDAGPDETKLALSLDANAALISPPSLILGEIPQAWVPGWPPRRVHLTAVATQGERTQWLASSGYRRILLQNISAVLGPLDLSGAGTLDHQGSGGLSVHASGLRETVRYWLDHPPISIDQQDENGIGPWLIKARAHLDSIPNAADLPLQVTRGEISDLVPIMAKILQAQ
ncbi:DUF2125 domain-containing protein [Kozakia baliensis]|uniref:DUF2125 domain-containing protein n=1 Tax=Kozakia baliensis TaxID=153496 RepID=UPI000496B148|nr:DUF2125 domain-containing protein [Kozakia baliensis]